MQRILTNAEMREADLYTIEKLGVSEEDLAKGFATIPDLKIEL